uniref:tetratricopeptide repeat protein 6 isoform X1 n=2 Tax=Myodes glareolus TaxID=447135 RepID=UPI002020775D|nr:tetratricopeptide repeat protein 6 isoform X1 [Myodes glareolus]XP_048271666.1 tetratricopeptide repeat protein 6 isoform X1 [Myodes glareolus]
MSTIPKHFGLTAREESFMFKELEKIRQESKKEYHQFKQKLADRPPFGVSSEDDLEDGQDQEARPHSARAKGKVSWAAKPSSPSTGVQSPERPAAAALQGALQSTRRGPEKPEPFRPRDFYLRSSAFLRHGPPKAPPVIARQAGTARPALLLRPRSRLKRRHPKSRSETVSKRVFPLAAAHEARALDLVRVRYRHASSLSSLSSDFDDSGRLRKLRIHTYFLREGMGGSRWVRSSPRSVRQGSSTSQVSWAPQVTRFIPTNIEEIIASQQSEVQLASDQTIKELIQSILGQNYDLTMEGISLMEQMYLRPLQSQVQTPEITEEKESQETLKERPITQSICEELPEAVSSTFQIEQEDLLEWGAMGEENLAFKSQEELEIVQLEDFSKPLEAVRPSIDVKSGRKSTIKVRSSELLQIRGREVKQTQRSKPVVKSLNPRKTVRSQEEKKLIKKLPQAQPIPHLHDLCTTVPAAELPVDLRLASRVYHTPNRTGHKAMLGLLGSSLLGDCCIDEQRDRILYGVPVKKQKYSSASPVPPEEFPELVQTSQWQAHQPDLQLSGEEVSAYPGASKMFWNLTAPKFAIPESTMRETLYPKYESVPTSRILTEKISESKESVVILDTYARRSFKSLIIKKSASYENIQKYSSAPYTRLKRSNSTVELQKEGTPPPFIVKDDVDSNLKQLLFQKRKELERQLAKQRGIFDPFIKGSLETMDESGSLKCLSYSLVEASRKAGITYIVYPSKKKKRWRKGNKFQKLGLVYEQLSKPPKKLERSTSHGILPEQKKFFLKVPLYERQIRSPSVPVVLNFDQFVQSKGGIPENTDPRTWAIELFAKDKPQKTPAPVTYVHKEVPEPVIELPKLELTDHIKCDLPQEVIKYYESEVERLTQEIKNEKRIPVFAYCRRGAIYRKLGKLQSAMSDLQETIFLEPLFLNAYWHRHFIYLFQDKINDALDDLNFINKYNKNHAEAYLSKAEIFREKKELTLAILNYSQAIKCRPKDADLYFKRGEMYEKTNKVLAIDDYSKCIYYDPKRTDALMKRAIYYFENENWIGSIHDFTALLKIEPQSSQARTSRGRAYFKRSLYKQATQDFSVAIHLDPNNWLALYYRACLFRKTNPLRALQDYSVSVLINDGYDNLNCFLHRGILYAHLKLWMLAICDFETVISLERTATLAYVNIGLIYLLHLDNYTEAFWRFSEAIRVDPLYIQSYICRAETYSKLHKLKKAVYELSRAIHLQPDAIQLYIIRGQYFLTMKCYDLAKFTIYQVAEMNKGLIELTPIQQALIYSFCENHDKAISVLEGVTATRPEISTYALLAKAQMKAKKIKEALRIFKKALEMFSSSDKGPNAITVLAECLYNLGLCYMEEGNLQMAFDSFTKAVKANPDFADAFYHRGLCKVKLNKDNSILDFNRAITLNPKHYQAYLSRVAYYGLKGRYSKAILNCNEAIRLYPESVRAYICRGVLKYYNRSYKLAITDLTTAVNMDKNSYPAFYNRALCYTKIKEHEMALRDYGIVLLLDAGERITLNTFINRGLIYAQLKQYGFALEDFKQAALISETSVSLFQATAMCHHRIKEFEGAVDFFTRAVKINTRFLDAYIGRGNSYMEYGQDDGLKQAQKDFLKALHIDPSCLKARISLGYNLQAQGKFQKAWNHFTIAIEAEPKSCLAYEGRAVICLQMSNNFAAMQDINTAIKINTTAEFLTNRGVIHEFMGQQQNAMTDYQAAISLDPKYSLAYFNAGNIYFRHRQFSQASDYFSKALEFNPENEYALMNRAVTNTILKKYEEAKKDFSSAIDLCPHWAALYFNRASLHFCLKQYELAEEDLTIALSLKPDEAAMYNLRSQVRGKIGLIEEAMSDYNKALDLEECRPAM